MSLLVTDTEQRSSFIFGLCTILYHLQESKPEMYRIIQHMFQSDHTPVVNYLDKYFTARVPLFFDMSNRYFTAKTDIETIIRSERLKEESKRYTRIQ